MFLHEDNEDSDQTVCFHTLWLILDCLCIWPLGYETFFMLNSTEHEIFSANK